MTKISFVFDIQVLNCNIFLDALPQTGNKFISPAFMVKCKIQAIPNGCW